MSTKSKIEEVKVDLEAEVQQLQREFLEAKKKLSDTEQKLSVAKTILRDDNELQKREQELPPGFSIEWYHRHDPFESVYALYLHGKQYSLGNADYSDQQQIIKFRKQAWELWDLVIRVLGDNLLIVNNLKKVAKRETP